MVDLTERVREGMKERAELPGMSLMEHLDELRKRIVRSALFLVVGFGVAFCYHEQLYGLIQKPLDDLHVKLVFTHPIDPMNLYLQVSLVGGAILASPLILYQVWLFLAPGLYKHEQRFVLPFMASTVGLFLSGAWFGYHYVLPGALKFLIFDFGKRFEPMVTISEYTGFFLSIILGLGVVFELPILIFFLALFGIVSPRFLWKNFRYAIFLTFLAAAIISPTPDPMSMCLFAAPMLVLYIVGIGIAWFVHPSRRKKKEAKA
jgi:sec-independent protein translocase protein TatC